jgi:hypothetical protein
MAAEGGPDHGRLGARVKVLVAGASGFVGQRLYVALDRAGHDVAAMTRNPARYRGAGTPVRRDVQDPGTLEPTMAGCQAPYYLVHSLQDADFERKDAAGATTFGEAAARAGLDRSSTWAAWATTRTACPPTCVAAARSRTCSDEAAVVIGQLPAGLRPEGLGQPRVPAIKRTPTSTAPVSHITSPSSWSWSDDSYRRRRQTADYLRLRKQVVVCS